MKSIGALAAVLLAATTCAQSAHARPLPHGSYMQSCTHIRMHGDRLSADLPPQAWRLAEDGSRRVAVRRRCREPQWAFELQSRPAGAIRLTLRGRVAGRLRLEPAV